MTRKIIVRCDFFPGSGAGHLKRCVVLANGLAAAGFSPVFALDGASEPLPMKIRFPIELIDGPFTVEGDVKAMSELTHRLNARLVLVDSFRICEMWVQDLRSLGLDVFVIDDLGVGGDATLRIDYNPKPRRISGSAINLLGPKFFITDSPKLPERIAPARSIILHAGGTGNFGAGDQVYRAAATVAEDKGLDATWLCPNERALAWLDSSGCRTDSTKVIGWQSEANSLWAHYDIVVGPASTSLFEAIMQGCLPVSFPISTTQTAERETWLQLGHALHLELPDVLSYEFAEKVMELAIEKFNTLRSQLTTHSQLLDGRGVERVVAAMIKRTACEPPDISNDQPQQAHQRGCDLRDASRFLDARNSPKVRTISTNPTHIISWPEHLHWWLSETTEKFVSESELGPEAFFWHRPKIINGQNYLIGGWFPAGSQPAFTSAIRLLEWQLEHCAQKYPDHTWVATIHQDNTAVISLNRRFGFTDANSEVCKAANHLFPGISNEFVILQRKALPL